MRSLMFVAVACMALLAGTGCCIEERCAYATLMLTVRRAPAGDLLPDAMVTRGGGAVSSYFTESTCSDGACTHALSPNGAGPLTISLAGFKDATITFAQLEDDCGNFIRQKMVVELVEDAATESSAMSAHEVLGAGCNK